MRCSVELFVATHTRTQIHTNNFRIKPMSFNLPYINVFSTRAVEPANMAAEFSNANRANHSLGFIGGGGDPGMVGGGTYTMPGGDNRKDPTIQDYENIFGPAARDIKMDMQRNKRHSRWHLPDALKGSNPYLTDRIDGLITDTTASPFTTVLLPYKYIENVDAKIKWNVWSFDEGMASRVPYESAARTLTQTKRSYAGYTIRHGLAITMEHNFMMSDKGRENFKNQLQQLVGCIQYTNDLDVHIALITAQSYAKERAERYYMSGKTNHQLIREYIDLFGFMSKNINAMDIMIEDAKSVLRTWGAAEPNFLLCNSKLTFQMTMTPEKTQYLTQGPDGVRRLRAGPNISTYRGLNIIHSRSFSMEEGAPPRDVLRRRVRVAEYYRIPWQEGIEKKHFAFYDESKDAWQKMSWNQLFSMASINTLKETENDRNSSDDEDSDEDSSFSRYEKIVTRFPKYDGDDPTDMEMDAKEWEKASENYLENPFLSLYQTKEEGTLHPHRPEPTPDDWKNMIHEIVNFDKYHDRLNKEAALEQFMDGKQNEACRQCFAACFPFFVMGFPMPSNVPAGAVQFLRHFRWRSPITENALVKREGEAPSSKIFDILSSAIFKDGYAYDLKSALKPVKKDKWELVVIRPNIEHNMLGIIMGRGGLDELGATFWGQTELSCYDDSMHGEDALF